MNNYKYTAEELFALPETQERLAGYGGVEFLALKIKTDLARTENYQDNTFYHGIGGLCESAI